MEECYPSLGRIIFNISHIQLLFSDKSMANLTLVML